MRIGYEYNAALHNLNDNNAVKLLYIVLNTLLCVAVTQLTTTESNQMNANYKPFDVVSNCIFEV